MASLTDKLTDTRNAARPNSARVTSGRSAGGSTLACDNLSGWPTASKVHFVTYKIDSSEEVVAGTQLDCYGIVSGNSIGSFTVVDGTDTGHAVGDVVEMLPTAAWGQDLADALTSTHNRSGGLKTGITLTQPTVTDFTSAGHTHATAAQGGQLTGLAIATGAQIIDKTLNPYKFSVYRNAAQNSGNGVDAVVNFDTKIYVTGANVDVVTNKGRFTAPIAGFYHFDASVGTGAGGSANHSIALRLYKNGVLVTLGGASPTWNSVAQATVSDTIQLAANDYVEVYAYGDVTLALLVGNAANNRFSGSLVSAT